MLSNRYSGGYSVGDHLFPFRTEKLSPTAPMVLHTRGRVGRRQLFYKPLSTDLLREAFFCVNFLEGASSPEDDASSLGGIVSSPGGDASPRRHCQVGGRSPNLAIRKCIVFACQGIEPCQANADAGTRRPQVRTRLPQVRTHFLLACAGQINEKINVRLMKINVQSQLAKIA